MFRLCLALCGLLIATPAPANPDPVADRIYYGGTIISLDNAHPFPDAVAISGGRIVGVGNLSEVVKFRGANTDLIDLEGLTMLPGFVDAHGHLSRVGLQAIAANLMRSPAGAVRTIADIQYVLRKWATRTFAVREFGLIIGYGFDESQLTNKHWLTRTDLDAVSKDLPVIAIHRSGRWSVFNSRALELAGIRAETPDPRNGVIHRWRESGEPNGVLEGMAHYAALHRLLSRFIERHLDTLLDAGQRLYARHGHTTAQDSRPDPATLAAYPKIAGDGRLTIDVIAYPDLVQTADDPFLTSLLSSREYANGFRVGGVMLRLDGALRPETARLRESYLRLASGPLKSIGGNATFEDEEVVDLVGKAFQNGWPLMTYASGDAAIDQFIRAVRAAKARVRKRGLRPVIIQGQTLDLRQLRSSRALGIIPAILPTQAQRARGADHHLVLADTPGADGQMIRWLTERKIMFTAYHDAPACPPDILRVVAATVSEAEAGGAADRSGRGEVRLAALKAVSLWAARQYFEDDIKGSITVGKLADLVILSANPLTVNRADIGRILVLETLKEGDTVFLNPYQPQEKNAKAPQMSLACADAPACFRGMTAALNRAGLAGAGTQDRTHPGQSAGLGR